jgi:gamma-glutamylputrescine oxidase
VDVETWYEASAKCAFSAPPLEVEAATDVAVVGGGFAGLTLAWLLAGAGVSVALVEAGRVGGGASGRNGGFCSSAWAADDARVEATVGAEAARALHDLSREGAEFVRARCAEPAFSGVVMGEGIIGVTLVDQAGAMQAKRDRIARTRGESLRYLGREKLRAVVKSSRYHEALVNDAAFHLHPLDYCRALAAEAAARGAAIHEASPMRRVARAGAGWRVETDRGALRAERVVLAAGGYGGRELGRLRRAWLPITTYIGVTAPLGDLAAEAIDTGSAIGDDRRAGNYYRMLPGGRLMWGRDITAFGTRSAEKIAASVRREIAYFYPQLAKGGGIGIDYAWPGEMAYAGHMMPLIGPLEEGLWSLTAFGGHGVNTAPAGALVVAEALTGTSDRWRMFEPFGLAWNGGPFGPFAAEATYRWYQLRDAWRARFG